MHNPITAEHVHNSSQGLFYVIHKKYCGNDILTQRLNESALQS